MNFQRGFNRLGVVILVPCLVFSVVMLGLSAELYLTMPPKQVYHLTTKSNQDATQKSDGTVNLTGPVNVQNDLLLETKERMSQEYQARQDYEIAGWIALFGLAAYLFSSLIGWVFMGFAHRD